EVTGGGAGDREEQDAAPAAPVGEASPERGKNKLQDRKEGTDHTAEQDLGQVGFIAQGAGDRSDVTEKPAEHAFRAFEREVVPEQIRSEREDDREPDEIDVEREENNPEGQRTAGL